MLQSKGMTGSDTIKDCKGVPQSKGLPQEVSQSIGLAGSATIKRIARGATIKFTVRKCRDFRSKKDAIIRDGSNQNPTLALKVLPGSTTINYTTSECLN